MTFKLTDHDFWSLGEFVPSRWERKTVAREITAFVRQQATCVSTWANRPGRGVFWMEEDRYFEVRSPEWHTYNYENRDSVSAWHRDGCPTGSDSFLVLWASVQPTEVTRVPLVNGQPASFLRWGFRANRVYQPAPCEVVVIHNQRMAHRTPQLSNRERDNRWFARGYIRESGRAKDVPGVYAYEFG